MRKSSTLSLLSGFAKGARHYFITAVFTAAAGIFCTFLAPQVVRFTVDSIIGNAKVELPPMLMSAFLFVGGRDFLRTHIIVCALATLFLALLAGVFGYVSVMSLTRGTEEFSKNLRDTLFEHIQYLPFEWHTDNFTGDIIQRCTSDVETIHEFIARHLIEVGRTVILIVAALSLMFSMNLKMTLVCAAFMPFIVLYSTLFHGRIGKQFLLADEAEGRLMVDVQENLTGVRVVRAFGREKHELEGFDKKLDAFTNSWIDLGYTLGLFWGIGDFATGAQLLAVICAGAFFTARGEMTLGELLAFISYTQTLAWPVRSLGRTLSELSKAGVSIKRVRDILDAPAEDKPDSSDQSASTADKNSESGFFKDLLRDDANKKPSLTPLIEFKNVSFSYGGKPVLRDVSFSVPRGTTFGILGATGSGKSTITYLLNRLFELTKDGGSIFINGLDIKNIPRSELRRQVGLVLQEPFLFSKTIKENIEIASASRDIGKIRHMAGVAAVDDNIMEFRDGYDTVVGERGVTLSGGQKQRIAIARTLMMDCPILVFDDSLSAVDMETDEKIRIALKENTGDKTVIIISHRINTLMQADNIIVLMDGRVTQTGTHTGLMLEEGAYRRVYKMQSERV